MPQPKRKTESRRAARRQAERRVPASNIAGKLVIMLALVAAVVFGVAVFFKVSRVEVQGNSLYSAEQVVQASGIETGDNLLTLNKATVAGNIITQLPYVEKVSVGRSISHTGVSSKPATEISSGTRMPCSARKHISSAA